MPAVAPAAWLESYRHDLKDALAAAQADGFRHVTLSTIRPDLDLHDFGATARRHFAKHLRDRGLTLDALSTPWAGRGLTDPRHVEQRLAHLEATLKLCADLGVRRVTTPLAGLDGEQPDPLAAEALRAVADRADRIGVRVALAPVAAEPGCAANHLRRIGCPGLRLALDTAASAGPADAIRLAGLVELVQLRDVRRMGERIEEVEFGEGEVDFARVLGVLAEAGCDGPLVIRREAAGASVDALRRGREYIESLLLRTGRR